MRLLRSSIGSRFLIFDQLYCIFCLSADAMPPTGRDSCGDVHSSSQMHAVLDLADRCPHSDQWLVFAQESLSESESVSVSGD